MANRKTLSIGIVTGSMSRRAGGLFNSVRKSALHLRQAGSEVCIYAQSDEHTAEDMDAWAPLTPRVFKTRLKRPIRHAPGLGRALATTSHDVLHLHGIWGLPSLAVMQWKKATGGAVMISPRGMLDPWALRNSAWKKRIVGALFENRNLADCDCLHALNESEAASMRAFGLTNPIAIIPNGTDLPENSAKGAQQGRKRLVFLGRIHPKKGLSELLRAWKQAVATQVGLADEWELVIAGWDDGGHLSGLQKMVAELSLDGSVSFPGPVYGQGKEDLLRSANAFILPSYSEGLPMSVLEAWSYGLPVLMTDYCNLPIGFERHAAIRIDTNADVLAGQLLQALARDDLSDVGREARALAKEQFTWDRMARDHLDVYEWLCGDSARPSCVTID